MTKGGDRIGAVIRARGIRFSYGRGAEALRGIDLEAGPGLTLIAGANGAGKSTLMRVLAGVEAPDEGEVVVDGHDLRLDEVAARRALAYVPDQPDLTPFATLSEVMRLVARLRGAGSGAAAEALRWAGLDASAQRTIRQLSTGQRRRAMLAAARIGSPRVLLLDEPLENLDAAMRPVVAGWIIDRAAGGASALVASHDVEPFLTHASRMIVLEEGLVGAIAGLDGGIDSRRATFRELVGVRG